MLFRKSAKGQAETEQRVPGLPPRLRALLILVDGKRDVDRLGALLPRDFQQELNALIEQGHVEAVPELGPAAATTQAQVRPDSHTAAAPHAAAAPEAPDAPDAPDKAPDTAPPRASVPTQPPQPPPTLPGRFDILRQQAVQALSDELGAVAEPLDQHIERARDVDERRTLLSQATQLNARVRGRTAGRV